MNKQQNSTFAKHIHFHDRYNSKHCLRLTNLRSMNLWQLAEDNKIHRVSSGLRGFVHFDIFFVCISVYTNISLQYFFCLSDTGQSTAKSLSSHHLRTDEMRYLTTHVHRRLVDVRPRGESECGQGRRRSRSTYKNKTMSKLCEMMFFNCEKFAIHSAKSININSSLSFFQSIHVLWHFPVRCSNAQWYLMMLK